MWNLCIGTLVIIPVCWAGHGTVMQFGVTWSSSSFLCVYRFPEETRPRISKVLRTTAFAYPYLFDSIPLFYRVGHGAGWHHWWDNVKDLIVILYQALSSDKPAGYICVALFLYFIQFYTSQGYETEVRGSNNGKISPCVDPCHSHN